MKVSRRSFMACLVSTPLAAFAYMRAGEPDWFEVTEKDVSINRFDAPLRVLHLSDFHASEVVSLGSIERSIDIALQQNADLAVITGDFITWHLENEPEYQRILSKLTAKLPTFACIGNHDGGKWAGSSHGYRNFSKVQQLLEQSGITFLFNRSAQLKLKGQSIRIVGLGDLWSNDTKPEGILYAKRTEDEPIIVLSHNPDSKSMLKSYDWDLMCCGHTHGGQLVVPIIGLRPFLPVKDKSFPEGLLTWGQRHIHITRGIGNLHGMRFNCRPEISILNLS